MCFTPYVHRWHTKDFSRYNLRMSEDRKRMKLKFYWLPKAERFPLARIYITERPHIPEDLNELHGHLKAWNVVTEHKIYSGNEIVLETPDPKNLHCQIYEY